MPTEDVCLLLVRRIDSRSELGQTNAVSLPAANRTADTRIFSRE